MGTAPMPYPNTRLSQYGRTYIPQGMYRDTDPASMYRQNWQNAYMQGGDIDAQILEDYNNRQQLEQGYRDPMNAAYRDLAETPGYTQDEAGNIIRQPQYEGLLAGPEEFQGLNPSDEEWGAMSGDPNRQRGWFDPAYAEGINQESGSRQRGMRGETQGRLDTGLSREAQAYGGATDRRLLGLSGEYGAGVQSDLGAGEGGVRAAIDPNKLRFSGDVAGKVRMTDRDVQDYMDQAGATVGNRYASAKGDIERAAAATGATTPQSLAAMRARLEQQGAGEAADAVTRARLDARSEQARREMALEEARLGAERGYSGLSSSAELELGGRRLGQRNTGEQMRLGAERDISNRGIETARNVGEREQSNAIELGRQGLQSEQSIGAQAARTQAENQAAGMEMERNIENTGANRAADLYGIRRGNQQYAINTRFGQGMPVQQQLSEGYRGVANARRQGQGEYRDWTTGQTNTQAGLGQNAMSNRIRNYGAMTGAANEAAQSAGNYDIQRRKIPGLGSRLISAGLNAAAGYATGGWSGAIKGGAAGAGLGGGR